MATTDIERITERIFKKRVCEACGGHGTPYRHGTSNYGSVLLYDPVCKVCGGSGVITETTETTKPLMEKAVSETKKVVSAYNAGNISLKKITLYSALALLVKVMDDRAKGKTYGRRK